MDDFPVATATNHHDIWPNGYEHSFPTARGMTRRVVILAGPTNSGKTHQAIQALMKAASGVYLAPLRLMAIENHERMTDAGLAAGLITGEERLAPESAWTSRTIEMMNPDQPVEVGIIDEMQMLADPDRGWAWTRAILGCPCQTLFLAGAPEIVPAVIRLLAMVGETPEVQTFERLTPLEFVWQTVPIDQIVGGDAIIAFSRRAVLEIVRTIGEDRAVPLYGSMPPDVRRAASEMFRSGERPILVATDVIGMGLNLPIRRILFSDTSKFDGVKRRPLSGGEIRQIAGRAGRYGLNDAGLVSVAHIGDYRCQPDHGRIKAALRHVAAPIALETYSVQPTGQMLDAVERDILATTPERRRRLRGHPSFAHVLHRAAEIIRFNGAGGPSAFRYRVTDNVLKIATLVDEALGTNRHLVPSSVKFGYLPCPIQIGNALSPGYEALSGWVRRRGEALPVPIEGRWVAMKTTRDALEHAVNVLTGYTWLAHRHPDHFISGDDAMESLVTMTGDLIRLLDLEAKTASALRQKRQEAKAQQAARQPAADRSGWQPATIKHSRGRGRKAQHRLLEQMAAGA